MNRPNMPFSGFWARRRLPIVLQTESAECGLACLAMVAGYYGHCIDLPTMRRRFTVSLKGSTLKNLMQVAQALELKARPLKVPLEKLGKLKLPCVLHWDMNHFVVLQSMDRSGAVVHDPAVGVCRVSLHELSTHFTGVALELLPGGQFRQANETQRFTLLSLMGRIEGLSGGLAQLLALGVALQICVVLAPFFVQWTVDEALVAGDRGLVTVLGLGFLLLVVIQTAIAGLRSWAVSVLAIHLNFQWLGNVFGQLLRLPLPYFESRHLGDIVSRFGSVQTMQRTLTTHFVEGVIDGLLVVSTLVVMLIYSRMLAAVSCITILLYAALRACLFRALCEVTAAQVVHAAKQQTHLLESIRGVQSIRLFNRLDERRASWMNSLADQFNAELSIGRLNVTQHAAQVLLFNAERVVVVWLAALAVLDSRFSVGMMFAFLTYREQFSQRMSSLLDKLFDLRMLRLHAERVADIVLTQPEGEHEEVEAAVDHLAADIEVHQLSFRYAEGEAYVLRDLSFKVASGQCVAITGASGCGKTTLIKLLLGLAEPTAGEVMLGGVKMKAMGRSTWRRMIGTVMQDDHLFAGSIADNISFFDPLPDTQRIEDCARRAAIFEEIAAMPMGLNTLVGDIGTGLSGGQKQRILLARALYKNPRILVLDEATSHLDVRNERSVNDAIRRMELTRIIVAHRPETIAMAQRVIVLDQGRVARDFMLNQSPPVSRASSIGQPT